MSAALTDMGLLSPEMAVLLARVAAEDGPLPDPTTLPPTEGRAQSERANRRWNLDLPAMQSAHDIWIEPDATLGSARLRIRVFIPHAAKPGAVFFVHGGGFAFCSPESHERCARVLAIETNMAVLVPDYRLAPEHPYPAALTDVVASLRQLQSSPTIFGVGAGPIVIGGDPPAPISRLRPFSMNIRSDARHSRERSCSTAPSRAISPRTPIAISPTDLA